MKKMLALFLGCFLLSVTTFAYAAEYGTPAEAEKMVKKAVAFYKANGQEKAFAAISNPQGQFINKDLYVFVYDMNGKCVAHGFNKALIGKDLITMRDSNGVFYVKERIELVKAKGKGWQDYKFANPMSKKIESKRAYIEKADNYIFGCGAYHK
ncbi:MAG: cache domain-containing protein [Syntrophales bacterium]|nr:cache domain-containing protein [Syntrophales bacterium]